MLDECGWGGWRLKLMGEVASVGVSASRLGRLERGKCLEERNAARKWMADVGVQRGSLL